MRANHPDDLLPHDRYVFRIESEVVKGLHQSVGRVGNSNQEDANLEHGVIFFTVADFVFVPLDRIIKRIGLAASQSIFDDGSPSFKMGFQDITALLKFPLDPERSRHQAVDNRAQRQRPTRDDVALSANVRDVVEQGFEPDWIFAYIFAHEYPRGHARSEAQYAEGVDFSPVCSVLVQGKGWFFFLFSFSFSSEFCASGPFHY